MSIKIRNYTSEVPALRTIGEIEQMLVSAGAVAIQKDYRGDGRVEALSFKFQDRGYRLPSNTEKCFDIISKSPDYRRIARSDLQAASERIVWRVIGDWLHAQMSLIAIGQVELEQIMLPYMHDGKQSLYERLKKSEYALPRGKE